MANLQKISALVFLQKSLPSKAKQLLTRIQPLYVNSNNNIELKTNNSQSPPFSKKKKDHQNKIKNKAFTNIKQKILSTPKGWYNKGESHP